jgi:hypothetical protein
VGVAALSIATVVLYVDNYPAHWTRDLRAASRWLQDNGYTGAYADFRTAYTSDFVAGTDVAVVPYGPNACRFPDLTARVDSATRFAYLASVDDGDVVTRALGLSTQHTFGSVVVVIPDQPVRPWQSRLTDRSGSC